MQALSSPLLLITLMLPALANGEQLYRWTDALQRTSEPTRSIRISPAKGATFDPQS